MIRIGIGSTHSSIITCPRISFLSWFIKTNHLNKTIKKQETFSSKKRVYDSKSMGHFTYQYIEFFRRLQKYTQPYFDRFWHELHFNIYICIIISIESAREYWNNWWSIIFLIFLLGTCFFHWWNDNDVLMTYVVLWSRSYFFGDSKFNRIVT